MDDITDVAFRTICKELGADVTISEFVASDALIRDVEKQNENLNHRPLKTSSAFNCSETINIAYVKPLKSSKRIIPTSSM